LFEQGYIGEQHVVALVHGGDGVLDLSCGSLAAVHARGVFPVLGLHGGSCGLNALCVARGADELMGMVFSHVVYLLMSCYTAYNIVGGFEGSERFINQQTIV
jgi:hypothetical protein